jgi:exopolysaccharide biosynthesis polyprenyl glycosylphosphotransferase
MPQTAELTETKSAAPERVVPLPLPRSATRGTAFGSWFLKPRAVAFADLLVIGSATLTLGRLAAPTADGRLYAAALVMVAALSVLTIRRRRLWSVGMDLSALDEIPSLLVAGLFPPVVVYFLFALLSSITLDPVVFAALGGLLAGGLAVERSLLRALQRFLRRKGIGLRNTLIIGAGTIGSLIAKRLVSSPELGLNPVGFIDKEPLVDASDRLGIPVLGNSRDLSRAIFEYDVGMVIVAFSTAPHEVLLRIVTTCQERGVSLAVVPRLFETITQGRGFERLRGIPVVGVAPIRLSGVLWWVKRVSDIVSSAFMLLVFGPLLGLLALAVKLDSDGRVFYKQERVGRDGRPFEMVKFRTMAVDAERSEGGAMWSDAVESGSGTAYVTRVGRFLRKTSLDELPQLINVVRGDMSLVGPRPERPVFVNRFVHDIYRYGDRMRVKAGMTGWAQVNGLKGNHGSLAERVEYDNYYIENWSPWLDAKIIAMTLQQIYRDVRGLS